MRIILLLVVALVIYGLYTQTPMYRDSKRVTNEGPAEQAGRAVDRAVHKAGEAIEVLGERIQDNTSSSTPSHQ